jgi:hypothetical protein
MSSRWQALTGAPVRVLLGGRPGPETTPRPGAEGGTTSPTAPDSVSPGAAPAVRPGRAPVRALANDLPGRAARLAASLWERTGAPDADSLSYQPGLATVRWTLLRAGVLGLAASVVIVLGASQASSPYTLKNPGAWWFGIPAPSPYEDAVKPHGTGLFLGVVAVYAGMLLLIRCWYEVVRLARRYRGLPVSRLVPLLVVWSLPLLFVAPLFSHDLYSYAAQGEMVSHHISPYTLGPQILSTGSPFGALVDPIWRNVASPYGPVFLELDGFIVSITGHSPLPAIEGLRLLAVLGVVMFAAAIPAIARSYGPARSCCCTSSAAGTTTPSCSG